MYDQSLGRFAAANGRQYSVYRQEAVVLSLRAQPTTLRENRS
jgi:hypothetical protein